LLIIPYPESFGLLRIDVNTTISPPRIVERPVIKQPVIFFPGTHCDERVFMLTWQYLNLEERAYVPLQWADTLEQMMALSRDRLAYFDQAVHLVGFSMGGYIAALLALEQPAKITSLTLIGSSAQPLPAAELQQRQLLLAAIKQGKFKALSSTQIAAMLHASNQNTTALIDVVKEMAADLGLSTLHNQMTATTQRQNLLKSLAVADFKVHFVAGEQDHLVSAQALNMAQQQLSNSTLSVIAQAGHMLPLEQPLALADYLSQKLS
jgi:pimeloyl-ACP methyl ester carboxylesterase